LGTGSFPGVESGRGVTLTPHPLPLLSLRAFVACEKSETYLQASKQASHNVGTKQNLQLFFTVMLVMQT
jgi:hypothetical protein